MEKTIEQLQWDYGDMAYAHEVDGMNWSYFLDSAVCKTRLTALKFLREKIYAYYEPFLKERPMLVAANAIYKMFDISDKKKEEHISHDTVKEAFAGTYLESIWYPISLGSNWGNDLQHWADNVFSAGRLDELWEKYSKEQEKDEGKKKAFAKAE